MKDFKFLRKHYKFDLTPFFIALIYLVFCALGSNQSVWFDESYSGLLIRFDFSKIWELTSADVHPPLYYFSLKLWSLVFGSSDFSLRMMSAFFGALAIIVIFYLVKSKFNLKTANFATLLLSVSPFFIRYGQEMRMYTLSVFLMTLATYILFKAIDSNSRKYWLFYGLTISLGMWTHYFTAFAWLAHLVFLFFHYRKEIFNRNIIYSYLLAILVFLPWLPILFAQTKRVQSGFWIPPVSLTTLPSFFYHAFFSESTWYAFLPIKIITSLSLIVIAYITYRKLKKTKSLSLKLLAVTAFLPPLMLFVISMPPLRPVFIDRYLLYSAVFVCLVIYIIISQSISKVNINSIRETKIDALKLLAAASLVLSIMLGLFYNQTRQPNSQIKTVISQINLPILAGDNLIFYQALFYHTDKKPVYTIRNWRDINFPPNEPLDALPVHGKIALNNNLPVVVYSNLTDFAKYHNNFILLQHKDNYSTIGSSKLAGLKNFYIKKQYHQHDYIMTEYIKVNN